jgi:hypothetical protein
MGLIVTAAALAWARPAAACGGFFCSQAPMDQAGEDIAFVLGTTPEGESTVEAHVQIAYQGEAGRFAWVVPMPALPTLSVGSPELFNWLQMTSQPRFQLEWEYGQCGGDWMPVAMESDTAAGPPRAGGDVTVVRVEEVGPYTAAILQATRADALTEWLRANEYDLTDESAAALVPYLGEKYYFVALKLTSGQTTGDLRPLVVKYRGDTPCIPIKLTAIAARPDMPITAYVFAARRAVPLNYRHVLVNEARIDWLGFGSNYRQVASEAIDEAGGHAFLTEFAGPLESLRQNGGRILGEGLDTAALAALSHPVDFWLEVMRQNFPRAGLLSMARRYIPMPRSLEGSTDENGFYNRIGEFRDAIDGDPGRAAFDARAFAAELEESVVAPLSRAQAIIDGSGYVTRLFTTMSAEEMTVDPEFSFNGELGDVSNVHTATATCETIVPGSAVRITLANGLSFSVEWNKGPFTDGPAAARIEQLFKQGEPTLVQDNGPEISGVTGPAGCRCDAGLAPGSLALLALGLAASRRRRAR